MYRKRSTIRSQIPGQIHCMRESSVTAYGEYDCEVDFDSLVWSCSDLELAEAVDERLVGQENDVLGVVVCLVGGAAAGDLCHQTEPPLV